jgi:hypothetical protein
VRRIRTEVAAGITEQPETVPAGFWASLGISRDRTPGLRSRTFGRSVIVTNDQYRFLVAEHLAELGVRTDIILEPLRHRPFWELSKRDVQGNSARGSALFVDPKNLVRVY